MSILTPAARPTPLEDGERFRRAMGRIPTGVSIITSVLDGQPLGMTVGSLTHVSHHPPLVTFFAERSSVTAVAIQKAGRFGVNVLSRAQQPECYRFATSKGAKFDGLDVDVFDSGVPKIRGCVLWAECSIESVFDAGDHIGFLGRVHEYEVAVSHESPMVFYRSKVSSVDPAAGRHTPTEALHWW